MVSIANASQDIRALPGAGWDGVVRLSVGNSFGTGVLLYGGQAVLTCAHLFGEGGGRDSLTSTAPATGSTGTPTALTASAAGVTVNFETASGTQAIAASKVLLSPGFDITNDNNDLALVWLSAPAPVAANRYDLYRQADELGQTFTLVGYGLPGTGASGFSRSVSGPPTRRQARNRFDADIGTLKSALGNDLGWNPLAGSQLVADFDNGNELNDAFRRLIGQGDLGLGAQEGLTAPGDSGGPAFIGNRVAGIASYIASPARLGARPDIDSLTNSSFGEIASWQRLSYYQQWVDQALRANLPNAPSQASQVSKEVSRGTSGTTLTYFLLQFNGVRQSPDQVLTVDYRTRDGSAKAGEDYITAGGTLVLYAGETQAVIPVEIIGDTLREGPETFFLDVFNPVGVSFGEGVTQLTAMRTILDDDGPVNTLLSSNFPASQPVPLG